LSIPYFNYIMLFFGVFGVLGGGIFFIIPQRVSALAPDLTKNKLWVCLRLDKLSCIFVSFLTSQQSNDAEVIEWTVSPRWFQLLIKILIQKVRENLIKMIKLKSLVFNTMCSVKHIRTLMISNRTPNSLSKCHGVEN
jgi:hypothetical protein